MRTKIICTIGPNSESDEMIESLIKHGMGIARLNFSHDLQEVHKKRILKIRKIGKKLGKEVKILCDLQGPKIRVGDIENPPLKLGKDAKVIFTTSSCKEITKSEIVIKDPYLHTDVQKDDIILIDDGLIELKVEDVKNHKIFTKVIRGGDLYPHKGVNLPLTRTTTSSLTDKDIADLQFVLKLKPEFVAISFVQDEGDVTRIKNIIDFDEPKVICKIERAAAYKNLDQIIRASDGIMVARGDLGVEIPLETLPVIQKEIIKSCNYADKPVIAATQMLSSMTNAPFPTRADVSDIANAVFDGADAVMLSNETAVGKYPIEALKMMARVVKATEDYIYHRENKL